MISNQISLLQYPAACANAVILLVVVLMIAPVPFVGLVVRILSL